MKRFARIVLLSVLASGWLLFLPPSAVQAQIGGMTCIECHANPLAGGFHGGFRGLTNLTEPDVTAICYVCHNGTYTNPQGVTAPEAMQHEQIITGQGQNPQYGAFRAGCLDCHTNHSPLLPGDALKSNVVDEPHDVDATTIGFLLDERWVTGSTIVITNGDASVTYVEGADYQVNTFSIGGRADPIQIEILPGGTISGTTQTLLSSYEFGTNQQLLGREVVERNSTDGLARIRKPIISDAGTPGTLNDDFQTGWQCASGTPDDPACLADDVREVSFHIDIATAQTNWAKQAAPYNGACNPCHTRTGHHRRDESGGDHTHKFPQPCTNCHNHSAGWLNKGG